MKKVIPWLVYGLCVLISRRYCAGYWVVGPVFGVALLLVNFERVSKKLSSKHFAFVLASTLIYALVYFIADKGWKFRQDWLDMLAGSLSGGIVLGSILMPLIHAKLFGLKFKAVKLVSLLLIVSWYAVAAASLIGEVIGFKSPIDFILIAIALWQGIYLKCLKL